jgi:hypothetical protein
VAKAVEVMAHCERCKRLAPSPNEWETVEGHLLCPDCLDHLDELEDLAEDGDELSAAVLKDESERIAREGSGGISREEAMLWLNDRCGLPVWVTVAMAGSSIFLKAEGELRHWTDTGTGGSPEGDAGRYHVGETTDFNLTDPDLPPAHFRLSSGPSFAGFPFEDESLGIVLDGHVAISVWRLKDGDGGDRAKT